MRRSGFEKSKSNLLFRPASAFTKDYFIALRLLNGSPASAVPDGRPTPDSWFCIPKWPREERLFWCQCRLTKACLHSLRGASALRWGFPGMGNIQRICELHLEKLAAFAVCANPDDYLLYSLPAVSHRPTRDTSPVDFKLHHYPVSQLGLQGDHRLR
jgi:hypothetical protein